MDEKGDINLPTMRPVLFLIFTLLLDSFPGTENLAHADPRLTCEDADVLSIKRPFYANQSNSEQFNYRFRWTPAKPGKPTLVYFPGGPGGTSINHKILIPSGFGLIQTDPRGAGCNQEITPKSNHDLPDSFYTTIYLAQDALAALTTVGAKNFIFYGSSYGTMVATVAAGLAEQDAALKPNAVVLTGIIGEAFAPGAVFQGFVDQWNALKGSLRIPHDVVSALSQELPLGFTHSVWGRTIAVLLMMGKNPSLDYLSLLGGVLPTADAKQRAQLKAILSQLTDPNAGTEAIRLYQAIACHEISGSLFGPSLDVDFTYDQGNLIPVPHSLCDGIELDHSFHAGDWKTSAPIYYFEGSQDPSTPMNNALVHFKSQTRAPRIFVEVQEGGHSVLEMGMSDCRDEIFEAIANGGEALNVALKSCALASQVSGQAAGE
ncbi:alpha/beta fold hydrolase [Bdellovibrionota bacterium FG-1]